MAGDVAPAARPPLPGASQRVRDVTWEQILQHFAVCISDDLEELHRRFLEENTITFAAWKRLWSDARMSAAFHVEFRESSPTNTHKTILQQALDGLVWCIEERGGEFHEAADVAALIGRVFAMYCAYSVQLSAPKLKIDVDPQAWTALLSIDCVMCSVGASLFPSAAREVRAMMHRLAVQQNAFLRCLKGFGPSVRVQERARRSLSGGNGVSGSVLDAQTGAEEEVPIKKSKVDQLKALNDRYQELMSRTRSAGSASSARIGARRAQTTGSGSFLSTGLPSGIGNDAEELSRTLSAYVEYKANEAARRIERVERAAAVRESESRSVNEMDKSDRDDRSNILEPSDHGSVYSVPPSPMARSVASRSRQRSDSGGSEAFLAELESELHADIESDQVDPTVTRIPQRSATKPKGTHSSAFSEVSDVDNDALADLELELEQSVSIAPSRAPAQPPATVPPPSQRKRAQKPPATVKRASRALVSTQKPADAPSIEKRHPVAKRVRSDSVASGVSFAESWAASSVADSDGLAEIQAELDAIPSIAWPTPASSKTAARVNTYQQHTPKPTASNLPAAKPRAKPSARQATSRKRNSSTAIVKHDLLNQTTQMMVQHAESSSRALSVVSGTSELMQLQAELDFAAAPLAKAASSAPSIRTSTPAVQPRRSNRLSSVASEADSSALKEPEKELQATAAVLAPTQRSSAKTPRKRVAVLSKRPAQRTIAARSSAKKTRLNHVNSPVVCAVQQPLADQTPPNTSGKQPVSKPIAVATQASSRISSTSSDTESDGLAELVAELEAKTSFTAQTKWKSSTEKTTLPAVRKRLPVASKVATLRPVSVRPKTPDHTTAHVVAGLRRSARLSSLASDTESDGLEDLMAELNTAPGSAPASKLPMNTEKPKTRRRTTRKQPTRSQATKTRSTARTKQATKTTMKVKSVAASANSRVTRVVSATRQKQATTNRPTAKTVATQRSSRQTPPVTLPSSGRSTRSSSVAFDSDSDGLAELEAELQAGPS